MKHLAKSSVRLLALMLCLAATVPQLWAQTYTVAGTPASVLGTEWDPSNTSNDMVRMGNTTYYYLAKTANVNSGNYAFKVCLNHGWGTAYPSNNYGYSVSSSGTQSIVYIFNTSGNAVSVFGPFKTLTVAGSQTELLGSSWGQADANNDMTTTDGVNYTLSFTDVNVNQGSYQCKVTQDHAWTTSWPGSNYNYSINFTGTADVVFSFNVITKEVNVTVTEKSVTPVTPTYYITGDNGLGLGGFKYNPTTTMTNEGNGIYTYSYNVTTAGNYYFAFGDGQGSDWNDFNGNYRIGPSSGNVEVSLDGTWVNTQKGNGSYFVNVDAGPVTITLDVTNMRFNVVGVAPSAPVDYYVVGDDANIFPNGWSTGSENMMTEDNGNYTWTVNGVHLVAGTSYGYKVLGSDNSWHPNGNNATFTVDKNGTYNVVFTFDGTNVDAVPTLVQEDPTYSYTFYVWLPNGGTPYLYTWNDNHHPNGDWPGTQLSQTETLDDGNSWYVITGDYYYNLISAIVNLGDGENQTGNMTDLAPNTYYITWDGNNGAGYNITTDAPTAIVNYYVMGDDTSIFPNGWNTGSENLMTEDNGTYTWTVNNIHLVAGTNYGYKVFGSDNSWYPEGVDNATFTVDKNGTYNVVFTFDGTNVNAVPTLVQEDASYQYTFYVWLPNGGTPYLYTWNGETPLNGAWPGTQLTDTETLADENEWYVYSHSYYFNQISLLVNLGEGANQTGDMTGLEPNTYYITWDGNNGTGFNITTEAPTAIVRYYVVGSDTSIFPNEWNTGASTLMTDNGDGTYTWTSGEVNLVAGRTYEYKVLGSDNSWHPDGPDNSTFSVNVPGTYTVTVTYDSNGEIVNATATLVQAASYFITGADALGLGWSPAPTTALTLDYATGYYTYDLTVTASGTHGFVLADGQGSNAEDWDNFNSNYRIGPTSGDQTITLNSDWITTQKAGGDHGAYMISLAPGNYTVIYDPANNRFKVVGVEPIFITGSNGLGLGWNYAPTTAMTYDETTGIYSYTYNVAKQGDYHFVFATGQVNGIDDEGAAWNTFNYNYRIGPTDNEDVEYVLSDTEDNWMDTQMAQIGEGTEAGSYFAKLPAGNVIIYFDRENMRFRVESDGELADDLYMVGGLTLATDVHSYSPDDGVLMKHDKAKDLYYLNHVTLNTNATFCFSTSLGADSDDWAGMGTRYGNADNDENFFVPRDGDATAHLMVTGDKINVNMPLQVWDEQLGEWHMHTAGIYNVVVSLADGWVKLIKTDEFSLFPMNVYLEQTDNVEINNLGDEGHTYSLDDLGGDTQYWPLCAYNSLEGGWDPHSDANHYAVTFMGDTITPDGKKWWHWQVSASIAEVFFTRTNQEPYQSALISRKAGILWYTWEEDNTMTDHSREYFASSATKLPGNVVVEEGHYYVYFINTVGWETVYCVAWNDDTDTFIDDYGNDVQTWPGQPMTCIGIDPMTGYEVWEYDFGAIDDHTDPDNLLFHDGTPIATTDAKEQTGDFEFINGGVYDYLGVFDDAYTLNSLIRSAKEDVRYTISNDLLGVYYDKDAKTEIWYHNNVGTLVSKTVYGALYAKDLGEYGEPSEMPEGDEFHDYVYDICASTHTAGGSQIMDKKTEYDQSNWIKLVVSPNYDGRNHEPLPEANWPDLKDYVNHIIPGGTLDLYMTDSINPTARVMAITLGESQTYEPNVYVSGHFNDSIVFNYTHREWQPKPLYGGTYRTQPFVTWITDPETGEVIRGEVTREKVEEEPYKMFYVAPKPQEIAYLTWMVYDNLNIEENGARPYGGYVSGQYQPYSSVARFLPQDPGRFFAPRNWDRSEVIPGELYEELQYLSGDQLDNALGGYGSEFGPYSNGYMQYGGVKVNWSLFDEETVGMPWWQIFQPGQAYKIMAIIRYARGNDEGYQPNECYGPSNGDEQAAGHSFNAPRREDGNGQGDYANMYFTGDYSGLEDSKFIIFPILASPSGSNGDDMGNVTTVSEVKTDRTVVAVRYYNIMGVESSKPFDGINIVVTTYSDGSRTSKKVLR
jgi:hypothetical protein